MNKLLSASFGVITLAVASSSAFADSRIFSSETGAQATCPNSEVVWVDIEKSKYYHKASAEYGGRNGAYACVAAARARSYREALPPVQEASKPN